ncbi:MAG: GNAT family N-acetyltransferase [Nocardioidaceae bacterium]|nr:GNAT family N-acetyltransferase [Nocardioidaceae bacterium]
MSPIVHRRRTATGEDVDRLHALVVEMVQEGAALGWVDVPTRAEVGELVADLIAATDSDDACLVLVEDGDEVLGFAYWTRREMETEQPHADIGRVGVSSRARGGGIGRKVLQCLVDAAHTAGIEVLTLDVRGNNHAAMALYERFGFREYGRIPDFVAIGDERWDNVFYALDLRDARGDDLVRHGDNTVGPGASERRD